MLKANNYQSELMRMGMGGGNEK